MNLDSSQLAILKADILADPILAAEPPNSDGAFNIAAAYNLDASPIFIVWRTLISEEEAKSVTDWTEYEGLSNSKRDAYQFMMAGSSGGGGGGMNAADPNIRSGIQVIFSGPNAVNTRTQLTAIAKRNATRGETLFASGTGSDPSPGTMTEEGRVTIVNVQAARALP